MRALPGDEFLLASVTSAEFTDAAPVGATPLPQKLGRSNDGQDHTVSPYAFGVVRRIGPRHAHEVRLALHAAFRIDAARVHHSLTRGS